MHRTVFSILIAMIIVFAGISAWADSLCPYERDKYQFAADIAAIRTHLYVQGQSTKGTHAQNINWLMGYDVKFCPKDENGQSDPCCFSDPQGPYLDAMPRDPRDVTMYDNLEKALGSYDTSTRAQAEYSQRRVAYYLDYFKRRMNERASTGSGRKKRTTTQAALRESDLNHYRRGLGTRKQGKKNVPICGPVESYNKRLRNFGGPDSERSDLGTGESEARTRTRETSRASLAGTSRDQRRGADASTAQDDVAGASRSPSAPAYTPANGAPMSEGERRWANQWAKYPGIMNYSNSQVVDYANQAADRTKERTTNSYCYRVLKKLICQPSAVIRTSRPKTLDDRTISGVCESGSIVGAGRKPPGGSSYASNGVRELERAGFVNLLTTAPYKNMIRGPVDAPRGAVLIYGPRPGHAELKTGWGNYGGYASDYFSRRSRLHRDIGFSGAGRKLIGVMIPRSAL